VNPPRGPHSEHDPYLDPDTGVLRNLLGITEPVELAQADADFSALRLAQLHRRELPGDYNLDHLCNFHRTLFGDIYPWAGELRTVAIDKGDPFCLPQHIETFAHELFGKLAAANFLRDLDRAEFIDGLTELLGDLNALHPFRDGNGRTQRAFCTQLTRHAGHQLRWAPMDPAENIAASRASLRGDNAPLRAVLERVVDRPNASSTAPQPRAPLDPPH
jgi:cell filamentation protein